MRSGTALAAAVLLGVLAVACGGEAGAHGHEEPDGPPACEPGFSVPAGFRQTEAFEEPYADHVGIWLGFVSGDGRELHAFVGIPGEFGEGLPTVGMVPAAGGIAGPLQGAGSTWVLSWRAPGPCGVRAVLGSGFTHREFLRTLEDAGIVPRA